jgi:type II secretory pathway predicted ATPase ExeA
MIWWEYFGAQQAPFGRNLSAETLYLSPPLAECQARLHAVIRDRGVLAVTGVSGAGKTTALRATVAALPPSQFLPLYLPVQEDWTPRVLYRAVAYELGLLPSGQALETERTVRQTLWALATQQNRLPLLLLDEAHLCSPHLLQSLRQLLNFSMDSTAPLVLILAGHTELRRKLSLRPLEALRQRITVAYHVRALTAEETIVYVTHHLHQVAIDRPVFTDSALQAGVEWSQGLPRRINTWATACLLAAYSGQHPVIDDEVVATAQAELQWAGAL